VEVTDSLVATVLTGQLVPRILSSPSVSLGSWILVRPPLPLFPLSPGVVGMLFFNYLI